MSSTTLLLLISFERNVCGALRFMPSLLPRWLYDTMLVGLMPAPTRKSTRTLFILVCPDLKSSPAMTLPRCTARSTRPGTKVFCGEPLTKGTPSRMHAIAYWLDGEISASSRSSAAMRLSARGAGALAHRPCASAGSGRDGAKGGRAHPQSR